ncbi:hypothetical protein CKO42_03850 [Lamprobacter modestohalophilus]|uniref:DNA primase/polymerase bifunctional N-terminal domain-containing protein n=1 Tax=Lamprobacter modestohalophilus TaxID=1064514 RepID=A0A9X0W6A5_9GAMM|nr:hypothetical protein [Lamprobacter modestohalophilus]MBK1617599.1 hypothetical protein [Lamprobacter modestohalophilus]
MSSKPDYLEVRPENIPPEWQAWLWAVWNATQDKDGRWTKPPCNAQGYKISTNKPEGWMRFDEAKNALAGFDGFGVLIQRESDLRAIDLDAIDKLIPAMPEVGRLLARARKEGIYGEKSPSGTGLRLFVRAPWLLQQKKTNVRAPGDWPKGEKTPGVELFGQGFVTVTGVPAWKGGTIQEAQWLLDGLLALEQPERPTLARQDDGEPPVDLAEAVERVSAAVERRQPQLWAGDWQGGSGDLGEGVGGYPGQSEADHALACEIARQAREAGVPDSQLMEASEETFNRSGLAEREKWQDRADYRERTIRNAIEATEQDAQGGSASPNAIERLNRDHFIAPEGGKVRVFREMKDPETGKPTLARYSAEDFKLLHQHESIEVGEKSQPLAPYWLRSPKARRYPDGVAFIPKDNTPATIYNLWRGFGVEPVEGDTKPLSTTLLD